MEGARVERLELRRPDLRFPFPPNFQNILQGKRLVSVGRRAKYLLVDIEDEQVVIMHLGMSGSFRIDHAGKDSTPGEFHRERSRIEAHDHVIFHLIQDCGQPARVIYNDPRRFGFMLLSERKNIEQHTAFKGMGVEPVGNALNAEELASRMMGKRVPLKAALLDQRVVAGLGNIYVCEALWRAGLSPRREARTLVMKSGKPTQRLIRLTGDIRQVIEEAIEAGGSSLRDHAGTDGALGYFQHTFAAYDQDGKPCRKPDCSGTIERLVQSGRSTYYCSSCQR